MKIYLKRFIQSCLYFADGVFRLFCFSYSLSRHKVYRKMIKIIIAKAIKREMKFEINFIYFLKLELSI